MNKIFILCCFAIIQSAFNLSYAQTPQQSDEPDRLRWIKEIRNFKHDFLTKELDLSEEQQEQFFADYDEMEDRVLELNTATRELEHKVCSDSEASDVEVEAAARAIFELKSEEGKIELEYFDKFKNTLSPVQLIRIKNAERKFTQQLMQHHRRLKGNDGSRKR